MKHNMKHNSPFNVNFIAKRRNKIQLSYLVVIIAPNSRAHKEEKKRGKVKGKHGRINLRGGRGEC